MKRVFKVLAAMRSIAIIALVAVIWFSMVSCDDDDGGSGGGLTITGLTDYNGKYAIAMEDGDDDNGLFAAVKVNGSKVTGGKIASGSITLKVWKGDGKSNYTGSDTKSFDVLILSKETIDMANFNPFTDADKFGSVKNVKFTSGAGSGSFSEGFGF